MTIKNQVWINMVAMLVLACLIAAIAQWAIQRVESVNKQEQLALNFIAGLVGSPSWSILSHGKRL